jgi:regulator of protease activity HflC (stomatin/prohibitin superfamily)
LKEIEADDVRAWLARSWTSAKDWLNTRELAAPAFRRRVEAQWAQHRRMLEAQAVAREAERQAKAEAAAAIALKIQNAGITARGLIELVDVSPRTKAAAMRAKLADLKADDRHVRVFETTDPASLLVLESGAAGRGEYGIERDEGLVADLKLFAQANLP